MAENPAPTFIDLFKSREVFGTAIAVLVIIVGISVSYRELKGLEPYISLDLGSRRDILAILMLGFVVGVVGGVFGIGGPALSIPVLIFLGIPALQAVGAGLVQGIFVTSSTAASYAFSGNISLQLAVLMGPPYVVSQVAGWYVAQNTDTRKLKIALGAMLAGLGPYLLITI